MSGPRPYCPTHGWHHDPEVDRTWCVYTCLAADGTPLYVGMTDHPSTRLLWHAKYSGSGHWYYHCARVEVSERFLCRYDAHAAEVAEIVRLRPAFNRHHNPSPRPWVAPESRCLDYGEIPPIRMTTVVGVNGGRTALTAVSSAAPDDPKPLLPAAPATT